MTRVIPQKRKGCLGQRPLLGVSGSGPIEPPVHFFHKRKYRVQVREFLFFYSDVVGYFTVPPRILVLFFETMAAPEVGGALGGGGEKKGACGNTKSVPVASSCSASCSSSTAAPRCWAS